MQQRIAVAVLVALCLATGPVVADDAESYEGAHFKRVTFVVADMERSLRIYRDILGFDLDGISDSSNESYSYPVFKIDPEATIRFATLSAGTEQVRTMALTEVKGMELPKPGRPHMTATVIRVDDLDAVFSKLEELGLETVPGTVAGRPGEFQFKERAFVDFDGHLVVLYEILPNEKTE
ncbi:MAG TPA: VOC family protein [Candidatus Sulfomarinibacteraceae bacterium]|nr:VOC family protein [Candidatus Sulfomarinibacteraceae bacterium]